MYIVVPTTLRDAGQELQRGFAVQLEQLSKPDFVRAWCALAYLYPGLHPDGFDDPEGGWPRVLKPFAAEAWRRADIGELSDGELYPSDAAWAGLHDRCGEWEADEIARRLEIAAAHRTSTDV